MKKQEILTFMEKEAYHPLTIEELLKEFSMPRVELTQLDALLAELELDGQIVKTRYGRYGLPRRMNLIVGHLQGHASGFAFLLPEDPEEDDVFVPANSLNTAMHGDRVMARLVLKGSNSKKREGEVIRVLKRANQRIVGRFDKSKRYGFVIPDEKRLGQDYFVAKEHFNHASNGDKVVAEVVKWPDGRRSPEAKIVEILGKEGDVGVDVLAVIRQYDLPEEFPLAVSRAAREVPQEINANDYPNRTDLRQLEMVTIDGADARDLDDAVSVRLLDNGHYELGVHIADVGHFVEKGSILDEEAFLRGTSVYFPDRVIPMLPRELSNGICSLNPKVNRLALSIIMEIDQQGVVVEHTIHESIIKTNERMTYDEVNRILIDNDASVTNKYEHLLPMFAQMADLSQILREYRRQRGSIDFDFPEAKIVVDEETGQPIDVYSRERTLADGIIEEFMLKANETIAEHFHWMQVPFVYRVHEEPSEERIDDLNRFLKTFGLSIKGIASGDVHPKALQEVLDEVKDRKEENLINTVVLRSMKRAIYHPECLGHFGLAATYYAHFTSPIRRYPDLVIHRIIKQTIKQGGLTAEQLDELESFTGKAAHQATQRERVADEASRDVIDLKKVEFMADKVGEVYDGLISGVIPSGFFVALPNTIEGLVHISSLVDDYYIYDEKNYHFVGQRLGNIYRLGDEVKVRISKVDIESRRIDFVLHKTNPRRGQARR